VKTTLTLAAGVGLLLSASPAQACRLLIPTAKFDHSDVVVDGEAICLETPRKCRLTIATLYKGNADLVGRTVDIVVDEPEPIPALRENEILVGSPCYQTFVPETARVSGRFYLKVLPDRSLFAAHPVDPIQSEPNNQESGSKL